MFGQQFDLFLIAKQQPFPDFQLHSFEQLNKLTGSSSSSQNLKRTGVVCALCSYSKHRRECGVSEHTCLHTAYNAVHLILGKFGMAALKKNIVSAGCLAVLPAAFIAEQSHRGSICWAQGLHRKSLVSPKCTRTQAKVLTCLRCIGPCSLPPAS